MERWLAQYLDQSPRGDRWASGLSTALDLPMEPGGRVTPLGYILDHLDRGDEELLDVLHNAILVINDGTVAFRPPPPHEEVERHLAYARSIWSATAGGLVSRAEPTAMSAFREASGPDDLSSEHLKHAWAKAYERNGDPSDAWDHAVKAVEHILLPVIPRQDQAQIAHVVGQLGGQGDQYEVGLQFNQSAPPRTPPFSPVEAFAGMLRLIYPNPDRHVGANHRVPSAEEARVVVQLAIAVVQWAREGLIHKR
ncbi:hypothetical protein ACIA5D_35495 [Actinoplanes sp. NPDC051513]|uniref:hypothetical protein n=1 Tax=Actinoplanes sp. NPDC051513 TaxID=3363908 RepID=UPI0037A96849